MPVSLLDVNPNCLYEICKYLKEPDKVNLAQTCQQFKELLTSFWRTRWQKLELNDEPLSQCDLKYVLKAINNEVQSITACAYLFRQFLDFSEQILLPKLWSVNIKRQLGLMDTNCYKTMHKNFPNLHELVLTAGIVHAKHLVQLKYLTHLTLHCCILMESNVLVCISDALSLQQLHLRYTFGVTQLPFNLPVTNCRELVSLECSENLFTEGTISIAQISALKLLKTFDVNVIYPTVSPKTLNYILPNNRSSICYFGMWYIRFIPCVDVEEKILSMPEIRTLDFIDTNVSFLEQLANLDYLEELLLTSCYNFTDEMLLKFVQNCNNLRLIDIKDCKQISEDFIMRAGEILLSKNETLQQTLEINCTNSNINLQMIQQPKCKSFSNVLKLTNRIQLPKNNAVTKNDFRGFKFKFI